MNKKEFSNLTGKILIATPYTMEGNVFHKSLIYLLHHGTDGSAGLIFNQQVKHTPFGTLFKKIETTIDVKSLNLEVHLGGPVGIERGFFLHSGEYNKNVLFREQNNSNLAVSSNLEILKDIAEGQGPKNKMFIIGYTGWNAGRLEFEIENNLWLAMDVDTELIFSNNIDKWDLALNKLGILNADFNPSMGHC